MTLNQIVSILTVLLVLNFGQCSYFKLINNLITDSTVLADLVKKYGYSSLTMDPDIEKNVTQLITSKGYPCEEYTVQTEDGYLLGVQRIPHGRNESVHKAIKPVIFLQHGLLCSSTNWVANLPNESMAFILADAGFDVWLGNNRGNTYSRRHVSLNPDEDAFWEFSWDQFAKYDFPAQLNFALKVSGQSELYYVGHSQGTTQAFAALSHYKEMVKKVKTFFALAPVTTLTHAKSPVTKFADLSDGILYDLFGRKEFLTHNKVLQFLADSICREKFARFLCADVLFLIAGFDTINLNISRLPVYLSNTPAGTSVQDIVHFTQLVRTKDFRMYDFDSTSENMKHYNQTTPPIYNVDKMTTPVYLFYAENDWLADPKDVKLLESKFTGGQLKGSYYVPEWNHLDFIWAVDAKRVVYDRVIQIIKRDFQ